MEQEDVIDPKCMKCWISKIQDTKSKECCLSVAAEFEKIAQAYGRISEYYKDLQAIAQDAANANRELAVGEFDTAT